MAQCSDPLLFLHEDSKDESAREPKKVSNTMSVALLVASAAASMATIVYCSYAVKRHNNVDDSSWHV